MNKSASVFPPHMAPARAAVLLARIRLWCDQHHGIWYLMIPIGCLAGAGLGALYNLELMSKYVWLVPLAFWWLWVIYMPLWGDREPKSASTAYIQAGFDAVGPALHPALHDRLSRKAERSDRLLRRSDVEYAVRRVIADHGPRSVREVKAQAAQRALLGLPAETADTGKSRGDDVPPWLDEIDDD